MSDSKQRLEIVSDDTVTLSLARTTQVGYLGDYVYHGIPSEVHSEKGEWRPARILLEKARRNAHQREQDEHLLLRELVEPADGAFGWGRHGAAASCAAAAILADALDTMFSSLWGTTAETDQVAWRLREDFAEDVLVHCCSDWRLRHGAVLRWARGWFATYDLKEFPPALDRLPAVWADPSVDSLNENNGG